VTAELLLQIPKALLNRLDVGIERGLPQRDLIRSECLGLLAETPALIAREIELQLLGERVGFVQLLQTRGKRALALFDDLDVLRDLLFVLSDLLIAFCKKLILARELGDQ